MVINTKKRSQISVEITGQDIIESITSLNDLNKIISPELVLQGTTLFKNLKAKNVMVVTDRIMLINN